MARRLIALWFPALATDRLYRIGAARDPALPLVTIDSQGGRLRLVAVDAAAALAGFAPGMALADARALEPALRALPAEPAADARALAGLADWCSRYTPWTAVMGEGMAAGLALDITGCAHLFGGEAALLADLAGRLSDCGWRVRAGLADTLGAAWAVARVGPGYSREGDPLGAAIIAPGETARALAGLPLAGLRLDPAVATALEGLGLRRIGDLAGLPRAALANRFGGETLARLDRALGRAPEPISPRRPAAPHLVRRAFAEAIARTEDVAAATEDLVAALCRGLEAARQGARRLELAAYRVDGTVQRLAVGTGRPSRDRAHLARLFAEKRDRLDADFGFDALVLAAPVVEPFEGEQQALDTGARAGEADDLAELTDRLANRLGPRALLRPVPRQSHLPERAVAGRPPLAAAPDDADLWPAGAPRPLRLFRRPQEVEAVAPVPDDPPLLFRWQGETVRIRRADGPERIAPECGLGDDGAPQDTRDYYRVEDETGRRFWLFRAGLYDGSRDPDTLPRWFLHGLFG